MEYKVTEQPTKRFVIDFGLRPGYDKSTQAFTVEDVKQWYMKWQKGRADRGEYYFTGFVIPSNSVYTYKKDGSNSVGDYEPAARIEGEVSMEFCAPIYEDDKKVIEIIFELADNVGMQAQQERVHVTYGGKSYILENSRFANN